MRCIRLRKCKLCQKNRVENKFTKKIAVCDECDEAHKIKSKEMYREFIKRNKVRRWY